MTPFENPEMHLKRVDRITNLLSDPGPLWSTPAERSEASNSSADQPWLRFTGSSGICYGGGQSGQRWDEPSTQMPIPDRFLRKAVLPLLVALSFLAPLLRANTPKRIQYQSAGAGATRTVSVTFSNPTLVGNELVVAVTSYYGGAGNNGAPWSLSA